MPDIDRTEQQRAMREEMSSKANTLLTQMLNTDKNGRPRTAAPAPTPAVERTPEERIAEIDRLDPAGENAELRTLRDQLMSTVPPGPGDGGARQPLPAPTLGEQIRDAEQSGDFATSGRLKTQQLAAIVDRQNGMQS